MEKVEAAAVGGILGVLYGVILAASMDALSFASYLLYGNQYLIPIVTAMFTGLLAYITTITYESWSPYVQDELVSIVDAYYNGGDDDTESDLEEDELE